MPIQRLEFDRHCAQCEWAGVLHEECYQIKAWVYASRRAERERLKAGDGSEKKVAGNQKVVDEE